MSSNEIEPIFYKVNHRYKEEIIVPVIAIHDFFNFITTPLKKQKVITTDNVKCSISKIYTENLCALEEKVLSLYQISAWDFLKRWYAVYPELLYNLEFAVIKLYKYEQ